MLLLLVCYFLLFIKDIVVLELFRILEIYFLCVLYGFVVSSHALYSADVKVMLSWMGDFQ